MTSVIMNILAVIRVSCAVYLRYFDSLYRLGMYVKYPLIFLAVCSLYFSEASHQSLEVIKKLSTF